MEKALSKAAMRRLARRGGVKRTTALILPEIRDAMSKFVTGMVKNSIAYAEHGKRTTVKAQDVINALRKRGVQLYGY